MTTKMKGLLKGLRYISQIFDEDKEPEMQIGFPTDVKHVAHIGCDGPSVNSPSWMDSFKPDQDSMSGPLAADDSSLKGSLHGSSPARDLPDMPRSLRRSSGEIFSTDSSKKEKSEKTSSRHSRKSRSGGGSKELSDNSSSGRSSSRSQPLSESAPGSESPSHGLPDIPKKSRRKKSIRALNVGCLGADGITGGFEVKNISRIWRWCYNMPWTLFETERVVRAKSIWLTHWCVTAEHRQIMPGDLLQIEFGNSYCVGVKVIYEDGEEALLEEEEFPLLDWIQVRTKTTTEEKEKIRQLDNQRWGEEFSDGPDAAAPDSDVAVWYNQTFRSTDLFLYKYRTYEIELSFRGYVTYQIRYPFRSCPCPQ